MERSIKIELNSWLKDEYRKPLIIQGARQVGKTHAIKKFGETEFSQTLYLNFEQDPELVKLFQGNLSPKVILENISLFFGKTIDAKTTLLFFDEIQIAPEALTSLKYFYEQAPEHFIIAAGSLLGVSVGKESSFPVGKVNFLTMHPLTFNEYLFALGEDLLAEKIKDLENVKELPKVIHDKLLQRYKFYLFLGGMPEVVQHYINNKDVNKVRQIQNDILKAYEQDFSKYAAAKQAIKTSEVWNSIPYQLAKENKKFKYGDVRKKARSSTFELTIEWLKKAGLINLAYQISTPKIPLPGYTDYSKFKVYMLDTGLLGAMLNVHSNIVIYPDKIFTEYNGAFIENFVAGQLIGLGQRQLHYWSSASDAEVDFLIEGNGKVFPIEVKSGTNRNIKSLRSYENKYKPQNIYRLSQREYAQTDSFINVPLYAVEAFIKFLMKE